MIMRFFLRTILIVSLFSPRILSQDFLKAQFEYADSLYASGNYFDAITEFKRLMFFDTLGVFEYDALMKIGLCYKGGAKFDEATKSFAEALAKTNKEHEKYNAAVQIIRTNILARHTDAAINSIVSLERNADDNQKKLLEYWRAWALMFSEKWEKAKVIFDALGERELSAICKNVLEERYSPFIAKGLSYVIPGAGQIYTGEYLSGAMSFGWNFLWGYFTLKAVFANRVFDALVIGNLLWFRFYRGNLQNAEKFVRKKNIAIYNKAYGYLKNKFRGLKP